MDASTFGLEAVDAAVRGVPLRIVCLEYRETRSFGQYQNATVGASAMLGDDSAPEDVAANLKAWVQHQLDIRCGEHRAEQELSIARTDHEWEMERLRLQRADAEDQLERAKAAWEKAKGFLAAHGLDPSKFVDDEPF